MFGFNNQPQQQPQQLSQSTETCLICKGPCLNYKIPLEFDMNRGVVVHACSTNCQIIWQKLVQSIQQQQQQQQQQQHNAFQTQQFNPSFYDQRPSFPQQSQHVGPPFSASSHAPPSAYNNPMISQSFQQPVPMIPHHTSFPNHPQNMQFNPLANPPILSPQSFSNHQNKGPVKVETPPIDPRSKSTSVNSSTPQLSPSDSLVNKPPSLPLSTTTTIFTTESNYC
eukprot:TRINITY_DN7671_c0_g1_i5.p1 TRINITY_DN7671_c0_g1~~TRINITY_DN7671_c0_g1_i5.p1  ORF type:complete len:224 (+),score=61.94 TRINITY_DN7671_c0_g1_i5:269-940(+)